MGNTPAGLPPGAEPSKSRTLRVIQQKPDHNQNPRHSQQPGKQIFHFNLLFKPPHPALDESPETPQPAPAKHGFPPKPHETPATKQPTPPAERKTKPGKQNSRGLSCVSPSSA